jgi:hypothetical protein
MACFHKPVSPYMKLHRLLQKRSFFLDWTGRPRPEATLV